jgi:DNA-binding transcriptional regulator YhcF (GntR family)
MDRRRQAAPQVYEQLREQILSLALEPGAVLSRAELAARFGVSQTPVREALIHLGEEGLVDVFPQHATVVSPIDIPAALQSHFLRRAIELELVRELVTRPDAELKALLLRLRSHVALQKAAARTGDYAPSPRPTTTFTTRSTGPPACAAVAADTPARRPCRPAATPEPAGARQDGRGDARPPRHRGRWPRVTAWRRRPRCASTWRAR